MKIRVALSTNFVGLGNTVIPKEIELEGENRTVLDFLDHLAKIFPHLKLLDDGKMGEDLKYVYVNGVSHFDLPMGLKTELNDGDTVHAEIFMEPLAGG